MGPMTLFNKMLYFSSFLQARPPEQQPAAVLGDSTIWGVDYVKPAGSSARRPAMASFGLIQIPGTGDQGHHLVQEPAFIVPWRRVTATPLV